MNQALLLIDIQNDYFENGRSPLYNADKAASNAAKLLDYYRNKSLPVIHVQHINTREGATFFIPDTEGVKLHSLVEPAPGEQQIIKYAPNSFYETGLKEVLDKLQIKKLVVCGMMTHMCIDTTVRAARDYGYQITLIQDACATKDLQGLENVIPAAVVHDTYIASLRGVFAEIKNTQEIIEG